MSEQENNRSWIVITIFISSGFALGQALAVIIESAMTFLSFLGLAVVMFIIGRISLNRLAVEINNGSYLSNRTLLLSGIWPSLVWELMRRRFLFVIDIPKFLILFGLLYLLARNFERKYLK